MPAQGRFGVTSTTKSSYLEPDILNANPVPPTRTPGPDPPSDPAGARIRSQGRSTRVRSLPVRQAKRLSTLDASSSLVALFIAGSSLCFPSAWLQHPLSVSVVGAVSALSAICRCACRPARAAFACGSRFRFLTFFPPYSVFCDETIESVPECPSIKSTIAPAVLAPVASLAYYDSPHRQAYLIIINLMDLLSTSSSIDEVRTC